MLKMQFVVNFGIDLVGMIIKLEVIPVKDLNENSLASLKLFFK